MEKFLEYAKKVELPLKGFKCKTVIGSSGFYEGQILSDYPFYITLCRLLVEYMGYELISPYLPREFIDLLPTPSSQDDKNANTVSSRLDDMIGPSIRRKLEYMFKISIVKSEYERILKEIDTISQLHEEPWIVALIDPQNPKNYFIDLEASAENLIKLTSNGRS